MEAIISSCPSCAEEININTLKCRHCGEILDKDIRTVRQEHSIPQMPKIKLWNPGIAAILSLVIPGAGQMYKGKIRNGIIWFIFVCIGYAFLIVPGIILHIICIVNATSGDPYRE